MKKKLLGAIVMGACMLLAAGTTVALTPHIYQAKIRPPFVLENVIPVQFGDWSEEKNQMAAVISPETAAMLKKIYSQTLSRTYVNSQGERIMLSIAYGGDQSDTMQVHYPEVCYPAQGFQLLRERSEILKLANSSIPVKRLETSLTNQRFEPITYWTTVGDQVVQGGINKKIAEMKYGMHGQIPDGLLFRVSSIDMNTERAYRLQDSFVSALEKTLAPAYRKRLMGSAS